MDVSGYFGYGYDKEKTMKTDKKEEIIDKLGNTIKQLRTLDDKHFKMLDSNFDLLRMANLLNESVHRGTGRTTLTNSRVIAKVAESLALGESFCIFYVFRNGAQANMVLSPFLDYLCDTIAHHAIRSTNRGNLEIKFVNNSKIKFIVENEFSRYKEHAYHTYDRRFVFEDHSIYDCDEDWKASKYYDNPVLWGGIGD